MPWVKIPSETHNDMKQYLVDIEGLSLGDLVQIAFNFAMENLEDFEKFADLEDIEEDNGEEDEEKEVNEESELEEE